mgnify:CR=1 FL=1
MRWFLVVLVLVLAACGTSGDEPELAPGATASPSSTTAGTVPVQESTGTTVASDEEADPTVTPPIESTTTTSITRLELPGLQSAPAPLDWRRAS